MKIRKYKYFKKQKGQSTIEFLLCFAFSFGVIGMFISLALNFTMGYFVHYATYMAGRTYLVADNYSREMSSAQDFARRKAMSTFEEIFNSLFKSGSSKLIKLRGSSSDSLVIYNITRSKERKAKLFTGAFVEFEQKMVVPAIGGGPTLKLKSEAFLGKEPPRGECYTRLKSLLSNGNKEVTLYDDGC
ncbi:MAG: hypothetical protein HQK51_10310 [Oligoflexia bacterium]|nr:hypothetical protein [Oligoflexia bacterium]